MIVITRHAFPDDEEAQERLYQRGWKQAEAIVSRYTDKVAILAQELEQRREIYADDIQRLITSGS